MNYQLLTGDNRQVMRTLPAKSVHCVVTSPPYFGLRDYGTAKWAGGDPDCDHSTGNQVNQTKDKDTDRCTVYSSGVRPGSDNSHCRKCGATRIDAQIGLEPEPDCLTWARKEPPCGVCYVCALRSVFAEVWRVLRDDGVCWLNLGDSYNGSGGAGGDYGPGGIKEGQPKYPGRKVAGLKPKDLMMIPARVALALQSDGWFLRSDCIWSKPNPMPESVTDRPTKAHEYIFLLTKSQRYYYDAEAVREPASMDSGFSKQRQKGQHHKRMNVSGFYADASSGSQIDTWTDTGVRNRRSVWTVPTSPYPGAHFATFPPALIEPCVLAGCPEGGTVLDPFNGSGTTGAVACAHNRNYIGIDLSAAYIELAHARIREAIRESGRAYVAPVCKIDDFADMPLFAD